VKRKPRATATPGQAEGRSLPRWLALALLLTALPLQADPHGSGACHGGPPPGLAAPDHRGTLVLIIDDLGYQRQDGLAVTDLPGKLTVAVIPHTPFAAELAEAAAAAGKEVMLHLPMSSVGDSRLDRGALTAAQSRAEFDRTLQDALAAVPAVRGVNNHMGSELTQLTPQMDWLMQGLLQRQLYFVDSRTTPLTVAAERAAASGVPHLSRQVFLDNEPTSMAIDREFQLLLGRAVQEGLAVGIGHPYPETIAYLRRALPAARCRGIRLALVSEVLPGARVTRPPESLAGSGRFSPGQASETHLDAPLGHVGLGFGYGVFTEVEDTGG
jgi:polysaccharide deacetylase 2 family uncharacterized protein YibQ